MSDISEVKLLPTNASKLEQDVDALFDHSGRLQAGVALMRTAKLVDIPESYVPWLVYEYGLEEILPWVTDPREAMRTGLQWQRVRGTAKAVKLALSWVGFVAKRLEEEVPGAHFYEYLVEIDGVPSTDLLVSNIYELATLSAPARSRLARMYNAEYDVRRFVLDSSQWGDLLSDYSGVPGPGGSVLSFGRKTKIYAYLSESAQVYQLSRLHDMSVRNTTGFYLDYSTWGELPIMEEKMQRGRLFQVGTEDSLTEDQKKYDKRTFSRSGLVLSDSDPMGTIHAVLSGALYRYVEGGPFTLSDSELSDVTVTNRLVKIDERFDNRRDAIPVDAAPTFSQKVGIERTHSIGVRHNPLWPVLSETQPVLQPVAIVSRTTTWQINYVGQYWTGVKWPTDESWASINVVIGVNHVSSSE